jgi:hypothetical protein
VGDFLGADILDADRAPSAPVGEGCPERADPLSGATLREGLSMSRDGLARAAVMLSGLVVTTVGYMNAKARRRLLFGAT